jgi:sugar lactone lactonase YvrE
MAICRWLTGYTIANGPLINADSTLMLHTDSRHRIIYAFDLVAPAGKLSNKGIWKSFTEAEGHPV